MACSPIDCSINIHPEQLLRKLTKVDENGCPALNTIEVDPGTGNGPCGNFFDCENMNEMHWKQLVLNMIGVDANGCWAVRIIKSTPL